ncbi:MAG: hypothetical protein ACRC35_13475 [Angustibacter sp.]
MAGVLAGIGLLLAGFGWWVWSVNAVDPSDYGPPPQSGAPAPNAPSPPPASVTAPGGTPTRDEDALEAVPKQARAHTLAGAQAFAEFYEAQVNRAWMKPDPELIRPYALTECRGCRYYLDTAEYLKENLLRYESEPGSVSSVAYLPGSTKDKAVVGVNLVENATNIVGVDGKIVRRFERKTVALEFEMVWTENRWLLSRVHEIKKA